ncbi:hypothetical protein R3P38DRAFT_2796169 [Favolaschia claudopus]|uniref:Uncharacterized protein n=1 Tax=Favolaschia claudopus TaxID=2862362 RepID=A0AAW0A4U7_9AGAR
MSGFPTIPLGVQKGKRTQKGGKRKKKKEKRKRQQKTRVTGKGYKVQHKYIEAHLLASASDAAAASRYFKGAVILGLQKVIENSKVAQLTDLGRDFRVHQRLNETILRSPHPFFASPQAASLESPEVMRKNSLIPKQNQRSSSPQGREIVDEKQKVVKCYCCDNVTLSLGGPATGYHITGLTLFGYSLSGGMPAAETPYCNNPVRYRDQAKNRQRNGPAVTVTVASIQGFSIRGGFLPAPGVSQ